MLLNFKLWFANMMVSNLWRKDGYPTQGMFLVTDALKRVAKVESGGG